MDRYVISPCPGGYSSSSLSFAGRSTARKRKKSKADAVSHFRLPWKSRLDKRLRPKSRRNQCPCRGLTSADANNGQTAEAPDTRANGNGVRARGRVVDSHDWIGQMSDRRVCADRDSLSMTSADGCLPKRGSHDACLASEMTDPCYWRSR
jgi:hypothetical protein